LVKEREKIMSICAYNNDNTNSAFIPNRVIKINAGKMAQSRKIHLKKTL
jgi:hypothetical protein